MSKKLTEMTMDVVNAEQSDDEAYNIGRLAGFASQYLIEINSLEFSIV